jgi:hypothetical protein
MRLRIFTEPQRGANLPDAASGGAGRGAWRVYLQVLDLGDLDHLALIASDVAPQV